jgi:16S rRNA G527 N7-methylase RsmG
MQRIKSRIEFEGLSTVIKDSTIFTGLDELHPQVYSQELDKLLGFKINKIEQRLLRKYKAYDKSVDDNNRKKHYEGTETWIGLSPRALQTPYSEIHHFLSCFMKNYHPSTVVDLGAGYGRVGIVMNALYPKAKFIGYEILEARLREAQRVFEKLELNNCEMRLQNLLDFNFEIPQADIYFIYDFSQSFDLRLILDKFTQKLEGDQFFLIAKGERVRNLINTEYTQFKSPKRFLDNKRWSLYSSAVDIIHTPR